MKFLTAEPTLIDAIAALSGGAPVAFTIAVGVAACALFAHMATR